MSRIHVFTSAAGNYLPKVSVLFDSIAEHQPDWHRHLLLVEDWTDAECAALQLDAEICQPRDLDIPDWRPWAFCHAMVELCTAVKPFMLRQLLAREDCDAVVYLDPDICVFSPLGDVTSALHDHAILLTPHQAQPETALAGVMSNELTSLRYGTYNLGFIAVASNQTGRAFADWWCRRAYRFNRDDVPNGLFTDQRWMDLVPGMFEDVAVMRQPRLNVASWNAHQRDLTLDTGGGVLVQGEPLGFYHFTGLDSGQHDAALHYSGQSQGIESNLVQYYREAVTDRTRQYPCAEWSFGALADGSRVEDSWRRAYRDSVAMQARFPDPWRAEGVAEALDQVAEQAVPGFVSPGFSAGKDDAVDAQRVVSQAASAMRRPARWGAIVRAISTIMRREGWRGIRRRLSRSSEEQM